MTTRACSLLLLRRLVSSRPLPCRRAVMVRRPWRRRRMMVTTQRQWYSHHQKDNVQDDVNPPPPKTTTTTISPLPNVSSSSSSSPTTVKDATTIQEKEAALLLHPPFAPHIIAPNHHNTSLFPWRHSNTILERLSQDDYLLGGNVSSSHPTMDAYATAFGFGLAPWYQVLFFRHWQDDLAENISWAFGVGVTELLSHVYNDTDNQVPSDQLSNHDDSESVTFHHDPSKLKDDNQNKKGDDGNNDEQKEEEKDTTLLNQMVHEKLQDLYASARQHGNNKKGIPQIQVKLECHPIPGAAKVVSLFVFPFLSRSAMKQNPALRGTYRHFLEQLVISSTPADAMPYYHDFVNDYQKQGRTEHTVICQVLVPCQEVFWVRHAETGMLLQGNDDDRPREVVHLVRMERVVETRPNNRSWGLPFEHVPGNWQLTDIDDLLDGNLLL